MVWSQPRAPVVAIILEMLYISGVKFSVSAVKQITFPRSEIAGSEDKIIKLLQAGKHFKRVYHRIGPNSEVCVLLNLSILNLALTPWQVTQSIKVKRYLLRGVCIQKVSRPAHAPHLTVSTASFFRDACSSPLRLSHPFFSLMSTGMKKYLRNLLNKSSPFLTPQPLQPPSHFSGRLGHTSPCHLAVISPLTSRLLCGHPILWASTPTN